MVLINRYADNFYRQTVVYIWVFPLELLDNFCHQLYIYIFFLKLREVTLQVWFSIWSAAVSSHELFWWDLGFVNLFVYACACFADGELKPAESIYGFHKKLSLWYNTVNHSFLMHFILYRDILFNISAFVFNFKFMTIFVHLWTTFLEIQVDCKLDINKHFNWRFTYNFLIVWVLSASAFFWD